MSQESDKPVYRVLAPSSVAWWFTLALFAEQQRNLPMRDVALRRAAEIAEERRAPGTERPRLSGLGLPDWGTYIAQDDTYEYVSDTLGRIWQREIDTIYHPWTLKVL